MHAVALNYADDIQGLLNRIDHTEHFLQIVQAALAMKNQALNLQKCRALPIGMDNIDLPSTLAGIKVVKSEKILGIMYNENGSLSGNLGLRENKGKAKLGPILTRLKACGCHNDMMVAPLVLNADLRSTLLFGAGLWGAYGLSAVDPMKHQLQKPYSTLMRCILGVPSSCAHWIASILHGQLPIQYHIIKAFCKLWNRMLESAEINPLIRSCLQVQSDLWARHRPCWLKRWCDRLYHILPNTDYRLLTHALGTLQPIPHKQIMKSLAQWFDCKLHCFGNPSQSHCSHRRIAMVYRNFHTSRLGCKPVWHSWPWDELPTRVWKSWISFISAGASLPVHDMDVVQPFSGPCETTLSG
jgi:hypothetical protein